MISVIHRFCLAVSCVTSLPLARSDEHTAAGGLAKYLPAVGLLIGGLLVGVSATLQTLGVQPLATSSVILTLTWLMLSGGIHFDGLMDTADGVFSHRSPERMLEIMRDSRVGNFGVMTGIAAILLKIVGLLSMQQHGAMVLLAALLLIPAWARWCEMFAIGCFPYAREEGMGKIWHDTTNPSTDLVLGAALPVVATIICALNVGTAAIAIAVSTIVSGVCVAFYLSSIVRGHTGDTYGAVVELAETGGLLLLTLLAKPLL